MTLGLPVTITSHVMLLTWTLSIVRLLLVAMSPTATCSLLSVWKKRWGGGVRLLLTWNNEDSDDDLCCHHRDDVACPLMCQVVAICCCHLSVGYHIAIPCFWCEKKGGRGVMVLTWMNVESDDDRHCHHLDDIACPLRCHIVFNICCRNDMHC